MAKKRKGGLGRGLNSLLGDPSVEERGLTSCSNDEESSQESEISQRLSEDLINADDPKPEPYVEQDDHVQIMGVVSRDRDPKEITEARIVDIYPNPEQPRTRFKKEEIEELADSIEKDGLLQPILVREIEGKFQIIAGERRYQACKLLSLEMVPVRVVEAEDSKVIELAMVENIQRSDLNPIEEAYGYKRMMESQGLTQTEVAQAVSKGRSTIANALRLLDLPEVAQRLLYEDKISAGHARAILSVHDEEGRAKLTEKCSNEKISVREAEAIARLLNGKEKASESRAAMSPVPLYYKKAARSLKEQLGTNVKIKSSKGKNRLEIEFKDEEDLKRLFQSIVGEA